jgi:hypothetical protein
MTVTWVSASAVDLAYFTIFGRAMRVLKKSLAQKTKTSYNNRLIKA